MMSTRRPMGALEDHVMAYLWAVEEAAAPEVHQAVAPDLAYNNGDHGALPAMGKGESRAQPPRPVLCVLAGAVEAEHRADSMTTTLGAAADRAAVLSSFVDGLTPSDVKVLRDLLDQEEDS